MGKTLLFVLVVFCFFSTTIGVDHYRSTPKKVYVKLGNNLTISADLPFTFLLKNHTDPHYYWTKERFHPASSTHGKGYSIGHAGNCSVQQKYYQKRITNCGKNLTIENVTKWDSGRYVARYKYRKRTSDFEFIDVTVFEFFPVLAAVYYNKYYTVVNCVDLKNPHAQRYVEQQKIAHHFKAIISAYPNHPGYYKLEVDLEYGILVKEDINEDHFYANFRCCSQYKGSTSCGPWTLIYHHMYLPTSGNSWRPWCEHRGERHLVKVWKDGPHHGNLFEPTCHQRVFGPTNSLLCEGETSQIINFTSPLKMLRELGGIKKLTDLPPYIINKTHFYDEGTYFENEKNTTFQVSVKPRLYAALQIIKREHGYIKLNCTHTGSKEAQITWHIEGQYAKIETDGQTARVYELCWQDYTYWKADLGVKCHVSDPPFSVYSRWLMVHFTTTNYLRCYDRGIRKYVYWCSWNKAKGELI